jgi:hypothetical protein
VRERERRGKGRKEGVREYFKEKYRDKWGWEEKTLDKSGQEELSREVTFKQRPKATAKTKRTWRGESLSSHWEEKKA